MTLPPEVLETYEVLGRIREGGMGAVYKVRHRHLGAIRVVKVLRPEDRADPELIERFKREARLGGGLSHPNLAQILDLSPDFTWAVMEYVDGIALDDLLRKQGPQPVGLALEIARQALSALAYLHRKGSVHRDVSPDNLMLTQDSDGRPVVKLIDLGIARSLSGTGRLTAKGMFIGKPRYASPEQAGQSLWIDGRTDLYSLGLVLYELLTGRIPFEAPSVEALLEDRYYREPLGFEVTDPAGRVPPELRAFLLKALSRRPEERFASAEDMSRALADLQARFPLDGGQVVAPEPAPVPPVPLHAASTRQERPEAAETSETPGPLSAETRRSAPPPEIAAPAVTRVEAPPPRPQPARAESRRAPPAPARLPPRPQSQNGKRFAAALAVLLLAALLWQRFSGRDRDPAGDSAATPVEVSTPVPAPAGESVATGARDEGGTEAAGSLATAIVPDLRPQKREAETPEPIPPPPASPRETPKADPEPEPLRKKETRKEKSEKEPSETTPSSPVNWEKVRPAPAPVPKTVSPTEERRADEERLSVPIELPRETPAPGGRKPSQGMEWVAASPISIPDVVMPEAALGYEGRVVVTVRVGVDTAGRVTEARALEVTPPDLAQRADFERAAVAAARRARFNPGTENGAAVASFQVLSFTFEAQAP